MRCSRVSIVAFLTWTAILAQSNPSQVSITPEVEAALDHVRAADLRDDLAYIASDKLEGRDSPSQGLDLAAEYIATQFRGAGLEPGVGDSYFQNASMLVEEANFSNFELELSSGDRQFAANQKDAVLRLAASLDLKDAPLFKLDLADRAVVQHLTASQVQDKVVIAEIDPKRFAGYRLARRILREAKPALVILVDKKGLTTRGQRPRQLVDPTRTDDDVASPRVTLTGEAAERVLRGTQAWRGQRDCVGTHRRAASHARHAAQRDRSFARLRPSLARYLRPADRALRSPGHAA